MPKSVYLVTDNDGEHDHVLAVFSSRRLANALAKLGNWSVDSSPLDPDPTSLVCYKVEGYDDHPRTTCIFRIHRTTDTGYNSPSYEGASGDEDEFSPVHLSPCTGGLSDPPVASLRSHTSQTSLGGTGGL